MQKLSLAVAVLCMTMGDAKPPGFSCGNCRSPKFHSKAFYLPFCAEDADGAEVTHPDICGAICAEKYKKGSCDGCEKKCSAVFTPVCSPDQALLFANECHAKCAGVEDFQDCKGVNVVIPGKTKLPPNRIPPKKLQQQPGGGEQDSENGDEEI